MNPMNEILPAILAQDEKTFRQQVKLVETIVPTVHIDIMDGAFVPNTTWNDFAAMAKMDTPLAFEFHLMVEDPEPYIRKIVDMKCARRVLWHVESMGDHRELLNMSHGHLKEAGLAIIPKTPLHILDAYAGRMDEILVMGNEPGFSGKPIDPSAIERARQLHSKQPEIILGWDIGVNTNSIPLIRSAGITRFCAASAIFNAKNPRTAIAQLQSA